MAIVITPWQLGEPETSHGHRETTYSHPGAQHGVWLRGKEPECAGKM